MPRFDVSCYFVVRAKIAGVTANDHAAAIAAVEADRDITEQFARFVSLDRPKERLASIDYAEETTGYLVDVVGDTYHEETIGYDCARNGDVIAMHRDPGQDVEISRFHHAALGSYADDLCLEALADSRDLFALHLKLDEIQDTLPRFISSELAGIPNHDKNEALSRMDQAIEDLQRARDAIDALPEEDRVSASSIVAFQHDVDDIRIAVLVDGKHVGHLYRERFAGRTWRDSVLEMNDGARIRGLTSSIPYLRERFGIAPEVTIQTHGDYYTIYDADGVPFSRVMFSAGLFGMRELVSGKSEKFKALAPALTAARAGLSA